MSSSVGVPMTSSGLVMRTTYSRAFWRPCVVSSALDRLSGVSAFRHLAPLSSPPWDFPDQCDSGGDVCFRLLD